MYKIITPSGIQTEKKIRELIKFYLKKAQYATVQEKEKSLKQALHHIIETSLIVS